MSEGVEWAAHCCAILAAAPSGFAVPMSALAEFHGVPPSYLAKALQALARAGIVTSTTGKQGGYRLARRAHEISLLEIVLAVDGEDRMFRCTEIRRRGPSAVNASLYTPRCGIASAMWRAEEAWRESLRTTSVADIVQMTLNDSPPAALEKGIVWIGNVLKGRFPQAE